MPFKSKAQQKKCYATDGFGGKVDCKEFSHATNQKTLPAKAPAPAKTGKRGK